jgi:WD40 repeat protein
MLLQKHNLLNTIAILLILLTPSSIAPSQTELGNVVALDWSADGQRIVSLHETLVAMWDGVTGTLLTTFTSPEDAIALSLSPDSTRLAVGTQSSNIAIVDTITGQIIQQFTAEHDNPLVTDEEITAVAWSPDGSRLAAIVRGFIGEADRLGSRDPCQDVYVWNIVTEQRENSLPNPLDQCGSRTHIPGYWILHNPSWNYDANRLLISGGRTLIWDATSGAIVFDHYGRTDTLTIANWSSDGQKISLVKRSGSGNNIALEFWDTTSDERIRSFGLQMDASWIAVNPSNTLLATINFGVHLWDVSENQTAVYLTNDNEIASFPGEQFAVWSPDSSRIATTASDNHLAIIDVSQFTFPTQVPESSVTQVSTEPSSADAILCPNTLPTRLDVGQQARVVATWASNLRTEPALDAERILIIPGRGAFTVVNGPVCAADYLWWQIEYDGQTGWTAEGRENEYWLEPLPESETSTDCPGAPAQRLQVGAQARQALTQDPLLVLESPSSDNTLFQIYPGDVVDVIGGPLCFPVNNSNTSWWQIRSEAGLEGWVAEGRPDRYYLDPV